MIISSILEIKESKKDSVNRSDFHNFIIENDHPCVMAKTVFSSKKYMLRSYNNFGSLFTAKKILNDLKDYLQNIKEKEVGNFSFIAVFEEELNLNELQFEILLWDQLQKIHEIDEYTWDPEVSSDPKSNDFSFSILGNSFYIVGMHPNSSRGARRSPKPTLIFNLHSQFERLKERKVYDRVKKIIRARDKVKNGSVNPMMEDFGHKSEAAQYSGRETGSEWKCPFRSKNI